jgi:hypothetical protein
MIDQGIFGKEITILCERFDRALTKPVMARYYEILTVQMDTAQFEMASRRIFAEETFFPSPATFIEKALGSIKNNAELEWLRLMEAQTKNERCELSQSGRRALTAIGGTWALRNVTNSSRLHSDFLSSYQAAELERRTQSVELAVSGRDT